MHNDIIVILMSQRDVITRLMKFLQIVCMFNCILDYNFNMLDTERNFQ